MLASRIATCKRLRMQQGSPARAPRRGLYVDFASTLAAIAVGLALLVSLLGIFLPLGDAFSWKVLGACAAGATLTLILVARHLHADSFGPANRATLARGALVLLLAAFIGEDPMPWTLVLLTSLALALDGVDGWLARRHNVASRFGARFDMETDALLLLILSMLVWQNDKAGMWILLAGLMRYAFVAASVLLPFLKRPLPPQRRRQAAFVTQAIILIACLSPLFPQPYSSALAIIGLAFLSWSFAVDVVYLARQAD